MDVPFSEQLTSLYEFSETLKETRPTAINLAWAVDRVISLVKEHVESMSSMSEVVDLITKEAIIIHEEDVSLNRQKQGPHYLKDKRIFVFLLIVMLVH